MTALDRGKGFLHKMGGRRKRILGVVLGIALVAVVGLVLVNMSASNANGASQDGSGGEAAAKKDGDGDEKKPAPIPVEVADVQTGRISSYISSTGNLVAEYQVKLLGEVEGRVSDLLVEEGQSVRKGQPLAHLMHDDAEISLNKAKLKETNARLAFERGEDLAKKELISKEDHDKFTMEHEIARQELAEAEWRLEKTVIRAPFSGQISQRMIQVGQHVRPGDELFQVTDVDPLIARIYLPERDVLGLEEGRAVQIALNANPDIQLTGRIRQISPIVDTATGTVKITIEAVDSKQQVRPGSFVSINIVRVSHSDAIVLPREAVLRELKSAHVFVTGDPPDQATGSGVVAQKREVQLGIEEGNYVEVLGGIAAGDRVIVAGQGGLKDGSPIRVLGDEEASPGEETADEAADPAAADAEAD
jgi:membrane fusion protein, multidrug efflux system